MNHKLAPLLIALLPLLPAAALAQAAAPAAAASAPVLTVRPEVATAIQQAVDLHKAGKLADALARLDQTLTTLPAQTPTEVAVLQRTRGLVALQLDRPAEAARSLEAALATQVLPPADQLLALEGLTRAQFVLKNYPAALESGRKAAAAGSTWPGLGGLMVRALYLSNDFAGAAREVEAWIQAGKTPPEDDLRILASAYNKLKDDAAYTRIVERLLRDHPRPEYWPDLLARVPRQSGWQPRYDIDLLRLRMAVGAMESDADYMELAELALKAGQPAEAQKVIEAGYAKGMLGSGKNAADHQKLRTQAAKQAADDRQALASPRPPAVTDARSASTALATGAALVSIGQAERGLEYMKAALGGALPDAAQARLQYAQALQQGGRAGEALETLRALAGHEGLGMLARLWAIAVAPKKS